MDNLIKGFLGAFFILLITFLGFGLIHAGMNARNADAFLTSSAKKISNSSYSPLVMDACQKEAKEKGYQLTFESIQPGDRDRPVYGRLKLRYTFSVPILSFKEEKVITEDLG
ncbi:MAG: hypothetical protein PUG16_07560 [Lachnospiraceae bacterium]|jgi:hypothetical protein|nr:hypothetical protein [Lachnospiraceae bacterium]